MAETPQSKKLAKAAAKLEKRLQSIFKASEKIPSYKGKAPFMDKINKARMEAHNIAWDLKYYGTE